jgi:galactonate dehydratase
MFVEEPINCQESDLMAEIARGTHLPIATGERIYTKWGFREILEKKAAIVLQPDLCHAGGITEVRLIAGMAEPSTPPLRLTTRSARSLSRPASRSPPRSPTSSARNRSASATATSRRPLRCARLSGPADRPGLGVELDDSQMADKIDHQWKNREEFDVDDGSVMDW